MSTCSVDSTTGRPGGNDQYVKKNPGINGLKTFRVAFYSMTFPTSMAGMANCFNFILLYRGKAE